MSRNEPGVWGPPRVFPDAANPTEQHQQQKDQPEWRISADLWWVPPHQETRALQQRHEAIPNNEEEGERSSTGNGFHFYEKKLIKQENDYNLHIRLV